MRTVGQLRFDKKIQTPVQEDSLYQVCSNDARTKLAHIVLARESDQSDLTGSFRSTVGQYRDTFVLRYFLVPLSVPLIFLQSVCFQYRRYFFDGFTRYFGNFFFGTNSDRKSEKFFEVAQFCILCISCIFILLSRQGDHDAVTSSLNSCQPSVYHTNMGESHYVPFPTA